MEGEASGPAVLIGTPHGDHVAVQVLGRQHGDVDDPWDGNWLVCAVRITAGGFTADVGASLRAEELRAFRLALEQLRASLRGEGALESMEGWLSLVVRVGTRGQVTVTGQAIDRLGGGNRLSFVIDDLDQSYLSPVIDALRDIEAHFPVVGTP